MQQTPLSILLTAITILAPLTLPQAQAQAPSNKDIQAVRAKAIAFLRTAQNENGSFAPKLGGPGVSALVVAGLVKNGMNVDDPLVAKTLAYMEKSVRKDGGIYDKFLANYTTSVAVMAFHEANKNGKYDSILNNATKFLKGIQTDEPESSSDDPAFGGFGYDKGGRPDLSNSSFTVEALIAAGVPKNDPAIQKALKFLSRCQNLPGEENELEFAKKATEGDKGGFTYTPFPGKKNQYATDNGGLRSLGSMTYGGLKSFLYAGVNKKDPRVKAALDYVARNYTLKENPGMGQAGLYYYYHTFAKAMDALEQDAFTDSKGVTHNWRAELFQTLQSSQNKDGSWANSNRAFGESSPELCTAFALLALEYCQK